MSESIKDLERIVNDLRNKTHDLAERTQNIEQKIREGVILDALFNDSEDDWEVKPGILNFRHRTLGKMKYRATYIRNDVIYLIPDKALDSLTQFGKSNQYDESEVREFCTEEFYDGLPSAIRCELIPKVVYWSDSSGEIKSVEDKVWIPTEEEMFGTAIYGSDMEPTHVTLYRTRGERTYPNDDDVRFYWTASACSGSTRYVPVLEISGTVSPDSCLCFGGLLPCFCLPSDFAEHGLLPTDYHDRIDDRSWRKSGSASLINHREPAFPVLAKAASKLGGNNGRRPDHTGHSWKPTRAQFPHRPPHAASISNAPGLQNREIKVQVLDGIRRAVGYESTMRVSGFLEAQMDAKPTGAPVIARTA